MIYISTLFGDVIFICRNHLAKSEFVESFIDKNHLATRRIQIKLLFKIAQPTRTWQYLLLEAELLVISIITVIK